MFDLLNYIEKEIISLLGDNVDIADFLVGEIKIYRQYWQKYQCDRTRSPLYTSDTHLYETHEFHLHNGGIVTISWDIEVLYSYAKKYNIPISHYSLNNFNLLLKQDLLNSADEFKRISNIVKHPYNHAYDTLLIIDFKPLSCCLFLDGRHRYIEYTKFNPNSAIPFYLLNDELCMTAILTKSELVTYIILHNISVINNFIMGKSDLSSIINLSRCLEPNYPK